ncbi:MAG: hypothetical protein OES09_01625 [Gammaproteobacteria bacterium]|nr:hypothetical protein [Gammaproteobacteria bacterium]
MSDYNFPTADQLDRLRAGLLDDDPVLTKRIKESLVSEPEAAARNGIWQRLAHELDVSLEQSFALVNQLRLRRREALTGKRRLRPFAPVIAAGAMAALALVLGVTLFIDRDDTPATSAAVEAPQMVAKATDYRVQANADDHRDLANNLDFYVWLVNQRQPTETGRNNF